MAGEDAYDIVLGPMTGTAQQLVINGQVQSYDNVPYVDLSQPWWSPYNTDLAIGGKIYFPTGPITPMYYNAVYLMLFNKSLAEDLGVDDLYNTVHITTASRSLRCMIRISSWICMMIPYSI